MFDFVKEQLGKSMFPKEKIEDVKMDAHELRMTHVNERSITLFSNISIDKFCESPLLEED